jgi:outer membrane protein assembly factor BamE
MKFSRSLPPARRAACAVLAVSLAALAGCSTLKNVGASASTLGGLITPYKIDILQGNVVVREQVQALQPGMPREQVQAVLGTPLVASVFHADRWDYVFTFKRQGQEPQMRRVTVFFDGNALSRIEADELPTEEEFVASLDVRRSSVKPPVLEATPEQLQAFRDKNPAPAATPAAPATPATTSYPPLEPR